MMAIRFESLGQTLLRSGMGDCTNPMFLLVDNSDSPSVVEQLQQGCGSGCYTFISSCS